MEKHHKGRAVEIRQLMQAFIDERLAGKLTKLADDDPKREVLVEQFEFDNWVAGAANKIGWLQVVTHVIKATDPKAKGTSLFVDPSSLVKHRLVGSHELGNEFSDDVVGSAAALDAYSFIKLEYDGKALLELAVSRDSDFLDALSSERELAEEWAGKFSQVTETRERKSSHALAKQVYWLSGDDPTDDEDFFLLSPLNSSSVAHEIYKAVVDSLYGGGVKLARQARKRNEFSEEGYCSYPNIAVQKLGSTKPQTVSQRNLERRGNNYLLSSLPPKWKSQGVKPPLHTDSVFKRFGRRREVRWLAQGLVRFLKTDPPENRHTRNRVDGYLAALVDELVLFASEFQVLPPGWSADSACRLPLEQQLWLDPWRSEEDAEFAHQREQGEWPEQIRAAFARWLNAWLKPLGVGDDEHREWQVRIQRELDILQEELPHV